MLDADAERSIFLAPLQRPGPFLGRPRCAVRVWRALGRWGWGAAGRWGRLEAGMGIPRWPLGLGLAEGGRWHAGHWARASCELLAVVYG